MKRRRTSAALLSAFSLLGQSMLADPATAAPNSLLRAKVDGRRWLVPQFRVTGLKARDQLAMPKMLGQLGALPFARDHTIVAAMVDIFVLAKPGDYATISAEQWAPVDRIFAQIISSGLPRILPTLTFKIDPSDPRLAQYCAQQETPGPNRLALSPAIANGSCLPQYGNADYQALVNRLTMIAVRHFELRFGKAIIGYEPVGGVAGEIDWKGTGADGKPVFGDVSPSTLTRYRQRLLRLQRGLSQGEPRSIEQVPFLRNVRPPSRNGAGGPDGDGAFGGALGIQFAFVRYEIMRDFYVRLRDTVRTVAPTKLFSLRMGAILDPTAVMRGTIFFQQFASSIKPDLMASDSSTFNHLYEGPVVAPTIYRQGKSGFAEKKVDGAMWMSFADRFATYKLKNVDYREKVTKQIRDSFESNGFRAVGFYMNPSEMVQSPEYLAFIASLGPYYIARPRDVIPKSFVDVSLSTIVNQPAGKGTYTSLLRTIRGRTANFSQPVAIKFVPDPFKS